MSGFEIKIIFGVLAGILTIVGYIPYLRDIFKKTTKPHMYTWLIWGITQGTATAGLLYGGGMFGSVGLLIGTVLVFTVFLLSFKYGTKDITKGDTATLLVAIIAILVWWQLDNPILSVYMVTAIDAVGFIPTLRKSFTDPFSETISFWVIMAVVVVLSLLANSEYNILTMLYLSMLGGGNIVVFSLLLRRREKTHMK